MSGWKTWAGGLVLILGGATQIVKTIADGHFSFVEIQSGLAMVGSGFAALGLGHKLDKNTEAVKVQ